MMRFRVLLLLANFLEFVYHVQAVLRYVRAKEVPHKGILGEILDHVLQKVLKDQLQVVVFD